MNKEQLIKLILLCLICLGVGLSMGIYLKPDWEERIQKIILQESKIFLLDPNFVYAIIYAESRGLELALSKKGARGLMQIMPATANEIAQKLKIYFEPEDLYTPEINIKLGCCYLNTLLKRFKGDLVLTLAAYNTGPTRVSQWQRKSPETFSLDIIHQNGVSETKNFVSRVLAKYLERTKNKEIVVY